MHARWFTVLIARARGVSAACGEEDTAPAKRRRPPPIANPVTEAQPHLADVDT